MLKYTLRYAPLLILTLLLVPLHFYIAGNAKQVGQGVKNPAFLPAKAPSSFSSSLLYSIATLPDGDAWAVGGVFAANPTMQSTPGSFPVPSQGIILHYTNNTWSEALVTEALKLPLLSVSLDSPRDGWAVGWAGMLVHYDGHTWSNSPNPGLPRQNLLSVAMLSATDGWAVGYSGTILHYNGQQWTQVPDPTTVDLHSVAFSSPAEGWAVGAGGTILHYYHGAWGMVAPALTGSTLNSVSMLSADESWAVGAQDTILHYRDGTWERIHPASDYRNPSSYQAVDFSTVAMASIRSGWIAGGQHLLTYSLEAWIEPQNTTSLSIGSNSGVTVQNLNLFALALSSAGEGWAVGSMDSSNPKEYSSTGVILHYQTGKWNLAFITEPG